MNKELKLDHEKVKRLLNRSVTRLEQPVLERLHDARTQALVRYEARHRASPIVAWAGSFAWGAASTPQKTHILAAAVLLAAVLFGAATYWNQVEDDALSELDIAILTDELPMHIYID